MSVLTWPCTHTREVQWLHGVGTVPVLAVADVVKVPGGSQQDPVPSLGDPAQLLPVLGRGALPDVQNCVLRDLSRVTNKMASTSALLQLVGKLRKGVLGGVLLCCHVSKSLGFLPQCLHWWYNFTA